MKRRIPQSFLLLVEAFAGFAHVLVVFILIANIRGPDYLGEYVVVMTMVAIFRMFALFGMPVLVMRELPKRESTESTFLASGLVVCALWSSVMCALMIIAATQLNFADGLEAALLIAAISVVPGSLGEVARAAFIAKSAVALHFPVRIVEFATIAGINALLVVHSSDLYQLFVTVLVVKTASTVGLLSILKRKVVMSRWAFSRRVAKDLANPLVSFGLIDLSVHIFWRIDILMLSQMTTVHVAGLYSSAVRIFQVLVILPGVFAQTHLPKFSREIAHDALDVGHVEARLRYLFYASMPFSAAIFVLAEDILALAFGEAFTDAALVLRIYMVLFPVLCSDMAMSIVYEAAGYQRNQMFIAICHVVANIVLNAVLIPLYSMTGAAVASLLTLTSSAIVHQYLLSRHIVVLRWHRICAGPIALAGATSVVVFALSHTGHPIVAMAAFTAAYGLGYALFLVRSRSKAESAGFK